MSEARVQQAVDLMARFAERGQRYLWTDAFAVTNYLGLALVTREPRFLDDAIALIDRVHRSLGRHRAESKRGGWISGRAEADGAAHPTAGGLRIGKGQDERPAGEPPNERLEWDRDGQYFHYLTKWMHALDQTTRLTGESLYNCWARELAAAAHHAFVYTLLDGSKRMYWKMSIDLSRPLVPSMGQHDPLDGLVTYLQIQTGTGQPLPCDAPALDTAIADFDAMIDPDHLATDDALGIGGLLSDACRLAQLDPEDDLLEATLEAALLGLDEYAHWNVQTPLHARRRLPFRELGLAIGLAAVERLRRVAPARLRSLLGELERYTPLRHALEAFWLQTDNQQADVWQEHLDINSVMLATSLVSDGFLDVSFLNSRRGPGPRQTSHSG